MKRIYKGKKYLIQAELAERWGMSREAVRKRAARPDFPKHQWLIEKSKLYLLEDIERYEQHDPSLSERMKNKDALNRS